MMTDIAAIVATALKEDIGAGDATTESTIDAGASLRGRFLAKSEGTIAGLEVAEEVFRTLDNGVVWSSFVSGGDRVRPGTEIAAVEGAARAILTGERTALNFLQRMSGIATRTRAFVEAVAGTGAVILDTRKTAPGLRLIDKLAVVAGGGQNHRTGLYDMVLVKDNHIDACGGITAAVARVRSGPYGHLPVEVECRTLDDVREAAGLNVDRLLLDNMDVPTIRRAVETAEGRVPLEVSGNVTLATVRAIAETGVQYVSVGALTHSVTAVDISMKIRSPRGREGNEKG